MNKIPSNYQKNNSGNKIKKQNTNYTMKKKKKLEINKKDEMKHTFSEEPFIIKQKKEIVVKTQETEEEKRKEDNTKKKLFTALNNLNDEINAKIDSKDKFKNIALNLDCFINKPPSRKNNTFENNETYSEENDSHRPKSLRNANNLNINYGKDMSDKNNYNNNDNINKQNENESKDISDNNNDNGNISKQNENEEDENNYQNNDNYNNNEENNPNTNNYFALSLKKGELLNQLLKNENSDINTSNINKCYTDGINNNNNQNSFNKYFLKETPKTNKSIEQNEDNINSLKESPKFEKDQKITLYNLDNEDKSFLKKMENDNAFILNDISFLNKKNVTNYNISLSDFDTIKILKYYIYLVKENKKEQIYLTNVKNNISGLKNQLMTIKKMEVNKKNEINKNKDNEKPDKQTINLYEFYNKFIDNDNIRDKNNNILSRYQNDLNYLEELINNMNEEINNI